MDVLLVCSHFTYFLNYHPKKFPFRSTDIVSSAVHLRVALEGLLRVVRDVIHRRDRRHGAKCRSTAVEKSEGKYVDDTDREQYSPLIAGANNTMDPEADGV